MIPPHRHSSRASAYAWPCALIVGLVACGDSGEGATDVADVAASDGDDAATAAPDVSEAIDSEPTSEDTSVVDTSVGLEDTSVGLEDTSVALEDTSVGLEDTSVGLEDTSVGLEDTSVAPDSEPPVDTSEPVDTNPPPPPPPVDHDGDGYDVTVDCDDDAASIHPGAREVCGNGIDEDCSGADHPGKSIHVLLDAYGDISGPALEALSNGCWEVHRVNESAALAHPGFRHCYYSKDTRTPGGKDWYFDDTNPSHDHALEATKIETCATTGGLDDTGGGQGWVTMSPGPSGTTWVATTGGVAGIRFVAQLYRSGGQALEDALVDAWLHPRTYVPQLSFTSATNNQVGAWTTTVCSHLTKGNWIALYVGSAADPWGDARYAKLANALNACTDP